MELRRHLVLFTCVAESGTRARLIMTKHTARQPSKIVIHHRGLTGRNGTTEVSGDRDIVQDFEVKTGVAP
jgi:hypothetical protein